MRMILAATAMALMGGGAAFAAVEEAGLDVPQYDSAAVCADFGTRLSGSEEAQASCLETM